MQGVAFARGNDSTVSGLFLLNASPDPIVVNTSEAWLSDVPPDDTEQISHGVGRSEVLLNVYGMCVTAIAGPVAWVKDGLNDPALNASHVQGMQVSVPPFGICALGRGWRQGPKAAQSSVYRPIE